MWLHPVKKQEVSTQTLHKIKEGLIAMDKKNVINTVSWHDAPTCTGSVMAGPFFRSSSKFFEQTLAYVSPNTSEQSLSPPVKGAAFSAWMSTYLDLLPPDQPAVVAGRPTHA